MITFVFALLVALLWGIQPNIHKYVLGDLNYKTIMVLGFIFYLACMLLFIPFVWKDVVADKPKISTKSVAFIAISSIFCAFLANVLYLFALKHHKSYVVSALVYSSPIFTLFVSALILKERITISGGIGVAFITIGILCLAFDMR